MLILCSETKFGITIFLKLIWTKLDFGDSRFGLDQSKLIKNANATSIIVIPYLLVCFKELHDSIRQIENNLF